MRQRTGPGNHRRGSVSVFVLIVILLMAGIILARARHTITVHRQSRIDEYHLQSELLADAGIRLARSAWETTPEAWEYDWILPPGTVHQTKSGRVRITTTSDGVCSVEAQYPVEMEHPPRVTRTKDFAK